MKQKWVITHEKKKRKEKKSRSLCISQNAKENTLKMKKSRKRMRDMEAGNSYLTTPAIDIPEEGLVTIGTEEKLYDSRKYY